MVDFGCCVDPLQKSLQRRPRLLGAVSGLHTQSSRAADGEAVHETNAGIRFPQKVFLVVLACVRGWVSWLAGRTPAKGLVVKVVDAGDAMLQMVERAIQGEPVQVFRAGFRHWGIQGVDPTHQGLVPGQAAEGALPQMAVRGDKAGNDPVAARIQCFLCCQAGRRIARAQRGQAAIFTDHQVALYRLPLACCHGQNEGVFYYQFGWRDGLPKRRRAHGQPILRRQHCNTISQACAITKRDGRPSQQESARKLAHWRPSDGRNHRQRPGLPEAGH